jgi:hypothetical protein
MAMASNCNTQQQNILEISLAKEWKLKVSWWLGELELEQAIAGRNNFIRSTVQRQSDVVESEWWET